MLQQRRIQYFSCAAALSLLVSAGIADAQKQQPQQQQLQARPVQARPVPVQPVQPTATQLPQRIAQPRLPPISGWVDLHAHLMGHLGFGSKLIDGAPDPGSLLPTLPTNSGC